MNDKKNIKAPAQFKQKLTEIMDGVYELFELSKEQNLEPFSEDGCTRYMEGHGKTCSQVAGQFSRPSEYLESLLDMIRVNYDQLPFSYFLNGNMGFLYDAIPDKPFKLGYVSITSAPNVSFNAFWKDEVVPYTGRCGYSIAEAAAAFAVVSTGDENLTIDFVSTVSEVLNAGFTSENLGEFFLDGLSQNAPSQRVKLRSKKIYAGFCTNNALDSRIRISLWLIL